MNGYHVIAIDSGAVNPALTPMATALRVGDHLLARMGAPVRQSEPVHAG